MKEKRSFSPATLILALMVIACLVMVAWTLYTYAQLQESIRELTFQKSSLEELRNLLRDRKFRTLLYRKEKLLREGGSMRGRVQQLIHQIVSREGRLRNLVFHRLESDLPALEKKAYQVQLTHLTIRSLVNCLYYIELLPGAKVESLYLTKTKRPYRPWDANFRVVVFSPKKGKGR